jgi:hypothetical protein
MNTSIYRVFRDSDSLPLITILFRKAKTCTTAFPTITILRRCLSQYAITEHRLLRSWKSKNDVTGPLPGLPAIDSSFYTF